MHIDAAPYSDSSAQNASAVFIRVGVHNGIVPITDIDQLLSRRGIQRPGLSELPSPPLGGRRPAVAARRSFAHLSGAGLSHTFQEQGAGLKPSHWTLSGLSVNFIYIYLFTLFTLFLLICLGKRVLSAGYNSSVLLMLPLFIFNT